MKACPLCKSTYDDWIDFCFNDGMPLVAGASVASSSGGGLESVLDAPDIPLSLIGGTDVPEPAAARTAAPPANGAHAPITVGAAGFDVSPEAPAAPLRIGAGGFEAATDAPPPPPRAPGAVDASALEDIAAVLGGRADPPPLVQMPAPSIATAPASPAPVAPPVVAPTPAPAAPTPAPAAPTLAAPMMPTPSVADPTDVAAVAPPAPSAPVAPDEPVSMPLVPPAPPARPAPVSAGPSPVVIGGVVAAAVAAAGVVWLLVRPGAGPPSPDLPVPPPTTVAPAPPSTPPPTPVAPPPVVAPPDVAPGVPPTTAPVVPAAAVTPPPSTPTPPAPTPTAVIPTPTTPTPTPTGETAPWGGGAAPASTGTLRVLADPDGSTVTVDDTPRGTSPVSLDLPLGPHRVRVEHAGYKSEAMEVEVRVGETTVPFNLKPDVATGQVNVYGPIGYRVSVDGHDMGPMPVTVQVSEGVRQFKLTAETGETCTIPKEVAFRSPGRPETVTLQCP